MSDLPISKTRLYRIFAGMKQRCYNTNLSQYEHYGAQGITVCDDWLGEHGIERFMDWALNNGYEENLSIDRIDPDGPYCPENCRWITMSENASRHRTGTEDRDAVKPTMRNAYPVVMTKYDGEYVVFVPDFNINTEGKTISEAIAMARDAIGLTGISWEDLGKELPKPTAIADVCAEGDFVTLVDVDFIEYRKKNDNKAVRRNVSLPHWLDRLATEAGINVSSVLQRALQAELGLT